MIYKIYQVDTFNFQNFKGNPACVLQLNKWFADDHLLKIAQQNEVSETAFFIKEESIIHLRWFTPELEMDLCGHGTLAVAFVIKEILGCDLDSLIFSTISGDLKVSSDNNYYQLDLPSRPPKQALLPKEIALSLNIMPYETFKSRDYLLLYNSEQDIQEIQVNSTFLDKIDLGCGGVIVTAKGNDSDFVSRYFTPNSSILEDPVTGSAHCSLVPFWSSRLKKNNLEAFQLSERGGRLLCQNSNNRVFVSGQAKLSSVKNYNFQ